MRNLILFAFFGIPTASMAACSGSGPVHIGDPIEGDAGDPDPRGEGGAAGDGSAAADGEAGKPTSDGGKTCAPLPSDAGTCGAPGVMGGAVRPMCSSTTPPTAIGGAIVDGTYVLRSATYFGTCPFASPERITWAICGTSWQTTQERQGATTATFNLDATVMASKTTLQIQLTCGMPGAAPLSYGYDATPTGMSIYVPIGGGVRVDTFDRR